ncbi:Hsp33 family molecular chaperone HslO [Thiohalomonas denitrificans]|uniref:Hsp33 family molecular chaperone HslO n=1 Tax=Thiohalomonas denitrificans TaxID=415747 RepID=UPI0026EB06A1|nr:Hsp33 family molecular chaperone HslO [Thiohalomonas denitrificans]
MNDTLQRFLFENLGIRGELVRLDASWQAVLERQDYPPVVRTRLGELMAASILLSATLKFDGSMTLQVRGDGPIGMMVVECTSARTLRGLAHWEGEPDEASLTGQFGDARLIITIDQKKTGRDRYQGIVPLEGDSFAEAIEGYLYRSEQLPTRLWLAADSDSAAGLLLQDLPGQYSEEDAWNRVSTLAETVTEPELLDLEQGEVIRRLFHEEDVRVFESEPVSFRCSCSRERVESALRGLGHDEVTDIIRTEGEVAVNCEFCNRRYAYDAVDVERLFAGPEQPEVSTTRH